MPVVTSRGGGYAFMGNPPPRVARAATPATRTAAPSTTRAAPATGAWTSGNGRATTWARATRYPGSTTTKSAL